MSEVLLLGGSIPALVAALELAQVGITVRIAETQPRLPQRPVRDSGGEVAGLFAELAAPIVPGGHPEPGVEAVLHTPAQARLLNRDGEWKPQPFPSLYGIPTTVPITTECVDMLGTGGAFRAYLDRVKPLLTIGKQENLAKLVDSRIGKLARELLVEPLVFERFGVAADTAEVSVVAPGLNEALTRAGSLTGSALQQLSRHVARETTVEPAEGWAAIGRLLLDRLALFGATPFEATPVGLTRMSDEHADADADADFEGGWIVTDDSGATHSFAAIIVDDSVDVGADADQAGGLHVGLQSLSSTQRRIHAEIGIQAPGAEFSGREVAVDVDVPVTESLTVLTDTTGASWSARVQLCTDPGETGWKMSCVSSAFEDGTASSAEVSASQENALDLGDLPGLLGLQQLPGSVRTWVEAAPLVTRATLDSQAARTDAWQNEWPDVLACSEWLTGGELGSAIADARARAVRLRRRLTGISG